MAAVRLVSTRTVRPAPATASSPRLGKIPLTTWDLSFLSANYIQKGLLYLPPPASTAAVVDLLAAALSSTLAAYYPVAGRFVTDKHPGGGCSVSIECGGQGVELSHAVADGASIADVIPADADVPRLVQSFFPLDGAVNHDGHSLPLFAAQVTELGSDGAVFLGLAYNHALSDGTAFWAFLNAWAQAARSPSSLDGGGPMLVEPMPLLERWSPDGGPAEPVVLPLCLLPAVERLPPPPLRERMLHFSAESLGLLKERAREELLAAGDPAGAAALTRFQALSSLLWRCITRARGLPAEQRTVCRVAINNRGRLEPPLPSAYFGNSIDAIGTEPWLPADLLQHGHGSAAAAVGRAVAAHTDAAIRARVKAWTEKPVLYNLRWFDGAGTMMGSSPRFDMYGCDFGWGRPLAARSGRGNKSDGKTSLYPSARDKGGMDAEITLTPEHMAALETDKEFWAAVTPDQKPPI